MIVEEVTECSGRKWPDVVNEGWEVVVVAGRIEKETGGSGVGRSPPSLSLSLSFIFFCLFYTN